MLMLYIPLVRRRDEPENLPEESSDSSSKSQVNPASLDSENQVHLNSAHRTMYIQEVRSNYSLERRLFW